MKAGRGILAAAALIASAWMVIAAWPDDSPILTSELENQAKGESGADMSRAGNLSSRQSVSADAESKAAQARSEGSQDEVAKLPLDQQEKDRLYGIYAKANSSLKARLADFRSGMDSTSEDDLLEEARLAHELAANESAMQAITEDLYILTPEGVRISHELADGLVKSHNMVSHMGHDFDAVLYLRHVDFPALKAAQDHLTKAEDYWAEAKASRFNALSFADRRQRVADSRAAKAKLREGAPDSMSPGERARWREVLAAKILPPVLYVDEGTYMGRVRRGKERRIVR